MDGGDWSRRGVVKGSEYKQQSVGRRQGQVEGRGRRQLRTILEQGILEQAYWKKLTVQVWIAAATHGVERQRIRVLAKAHTMETGWA